jgi:hypothetical protein
LQLIIQKQFPLEIPAKYTHWRVCGGDNFSRSTLFPTVWNSRINSWESSFIFNLQKSNNQAWDQLSVLEKIIIKYEQRYIQMTCNIPIFSLCTTYNYVHFIHTWAVKHLANMSILALSSGQTESLVSSLPYCIFLVCLGPPSSLLFVSTIHISQVHPPFTTTWLNIAIQVNNTGVPHLMYNGHIYIHHTIITIQLLLYPSSTLLGRPAGPNHSCREHVDCVFFFYLGRQPRGIWHIAAEACWQLRIKHTQKNLLRDYRAISKFSANFDCRHSRDRPVNFPHHLIQDFGLESLLQLLCIPLFVAFFKPHSYFAFQ